ncbi:hypothetical protein KC324_g32 [Hortaea werneckii]|nr:hypothetical protein KC324_g32 [Hortaea werneckii]
MTTNTRLLRKHSKRYLTSELEAPFQSVNQSARRFLSLGILIALILPNTGLLFDPCSSNLHSRIRVSLEPFTTCTRQPTQKHHYLATAIIGRHSWSLSGESYLATKLITDAREAQRLPYAAAK